MKASETPVLSFLQKSPQFVIPIYQRTYSWEDKQCRQLWEDIIRVGSSDKISIHFIGSIVYVEQGLSTVSHRSPLLVIDGQQRLTTLMLLTEALARAVGDTEPVDGFSAIKLRQYYLINNLEKEDRLFKLILSQTDKESLKAIISQRELPKEKSLRIEQNFDLFTKLLLELGGDYTAICNGLSKLVVVDIALNRDQDNPQLIFESMNSTGKALSQADLIRNYILMGLEHDLQTRLYEMYWRPMELDFGQKAYGELFDAFMRHYLTMHTGEIPRESDVYDAFKDYSRTDAVLEGGIEALVKDIRIFARYFCAMALGNESESALKKAFHDLRELKVDVAYPFLLQLYYDYAQGTLCLADFLSAVRLVESFVFRRAVCALPTNSLNKIFAAIGKELKKDRYLESIQAYLLILPSYRRFPRDEEFQRVMQIKDLYNFRNRSYWLRRMENHGRAEPLPMDDFTIEHIMPQNPELSKEWQATLGPDWQRVQEDWLHTLGNLTLTRCNSKYSDRPFSEKRDMTDGYKESPVRLSSGLGKLETWDEAAIKRRAVYLSTQAPAVWPLPKFDPAVLATYKAKSETPEQYTLEVHPFLIKHHALFEALRKEILAIDPCVSEKILKLYVAYKAETNFVDIVPKSSKLTLSLNMPFPDIEDPKHICRDVTDVSRWGNGDVLVEIRTMEELPYIMSLIRQAFEHQMGDGFAS